MDTFSAPVLKQLLEVGATPRVSLYLTTHNAGSAGEQDAIRLKKLIGIAEAALIAGGMRSPVVRDLLEVPANLPLDKPFWNHRSQGLAVFVSPDQLVKLRLPIEFAEQVVVGERFHVKPLVPMFNKQWRCYLLTLSQNDVALYSVANQSLERLEVPGLPLSMETALMADGADRGAQVHSAMSGAHGKQAAVFHGQGGTSDTNKDDLLAFFRIVNSEVVQQLQGEHAPLILACVDYLAPIYRQANTYDNLLANGISGNQEYHNESELLSLATEVAQKWSNQRRETDVDRFREHAHTARTMDKPDDVLTAAIDGRVDVLFVDPRATLQGSVDPVTGAVTITNNDRDADLLDVAIVQTLRARGTVHSLADVALPTNSPLAAILRY